MINKIYDTYTEEVEGRILLVEYYKDCSPMHISSLRYLAKLYDITNGDKVFLVDVDTNSHNIEPSGFVKQIKSEKKRLLKDAVQYNENIDYNSLKVKIKKSIDNSLRYDSNLFKINFLLVIVLVIFIITVLINIFK